MTDLHARLAENQQIIEGLRHDAGDYAFVAQGIPKSHDLSWDAGNFRAWEAAESLSRQGEALRKVLELHKPVGENWIRGPVCTTCAGSHYGHHAWPCPTVKALKEEMSDAGN